MLRAAFDISATDSSLIMLISFLSIGFATNDIFFFVISEHCCADISFFWVFSVPVISDFCFFLWLIKRGEKQTFYHSFFLYKALVIF